MILNFNSYNIIKESITLDDIKKKNPKNYTFGQMKKKFIDIGYDFLGTIYIEQKSFNNYTFDGFIECVPEDILDIASKYGKCSKYLSGRANPKFMSVNVDMDVDNDENYSKFSQIISSHNIDKVSFCMTMKGKMYIVFWNPEEKYFYFLHTNENCHDDILGFVELWIKVRTSGVDEIRKELEVINSEWSEKSRLENEKIRLNKKNEENYRNLQDSIKKDIETNKDTYNEVEDFDSLPENVKQSLNSKDGTYADYKVTWRESGPYDYKHYTHYINNVDLNDGYTYSAKSSEQRYWGD